MTAAPRLKVCLIAISLGKGGAERSTAMLSRMLESKNFEVHIVILNDLVQYPYAGNLLNLGEIKSEKDSLLKRLIRFRKLRQFLVKEKFDWIIDNRTRPVALKEWYYLSYIYKDQSLIYVIRSGFLDEYLPKERWISRKIIRKTKKIICVSKAIAGEINSKFNTDKAITIYNPIEIVSESENPESEKNYILFVGRLEEKVKNLTLLLDAYKNSILSGLAIHLKIVGSGSDEEHIKEKVKSLDLSEFIDFVPFTSEIEKYYQNALFTVLTSRYEGFPRVLIESLALGTPVVSVDCVSGPNEIIIHEKNGLLVENNSVEQLSQAMNRMVSDKDFYKRLEANTKESVSHLNLSAIAEKWNKLLKNEN